MVSRRECRLCGGRPVHGRGLCRPCYRTEDAAGQLERHPVRQPGENRRRYVSAWVTPDTVTALATRGPGVSTAAREVLERWARRRAARS